MYYAKTLKDLLRTMELSREFFEDLDEFYISFISVFFEKLLEEQMGLLSEIEAYNYDIFMDFKREYDLIKYGIDPDIFKKTG